MGWETKTRVLLPTIVSSTRVVVLISLSVLGSILSLLVSSLSVVIGNTIAKLELVYPHSPIAYLRLDYLTKK